VHGWHALVGLALFVLFTATVLPRQAARSNEVSPDTSFLYTSGELRQTAEVYGEAGRGSYVRARWTFDLAFPAVYGFFLVTSIAWLLGKILREESPWQQLNLLPLAAVGFDLLENTLTTVVMASFPARAALALALAPAASALKWAFVVASFVVLVAAAGLALARRIRRIA
jgi:hypothetical protein